MEIRPRPGLTVPTLLEHEPVAAAFQPIVDTYGTVPYRDLNPSVVAGISYVVMFGMMFGDVGHGALLVGLGLLLRLGRPARLAAMRRLAPFVIGAGVASTLFGLAYGEAFGPTGLVPTLWLRPLAHPTTLLEAAIGVGAVLIAVSYLLGIGNRWREAGPSAALVALNGFAGTGLFSGMAVLAAGLYLHQSLVVALGAVLAVSGLVLAFVGARSAVAGSGGLLGATVEVIDAALRIGSNVVSFTRLAAFGLTHAALGELIWSGTVGLVRDGPALWVPAGILLVAGNAAAFALEGLVAGVQALRLEYYEMFSRIFTVEGRPFRPWRTDVVEGDGDGDGRSAPVPPCPHDLEEVAC